MKVLLDTRYRCANCGEPLLRDGGNRHEIDQQSASWLCMGPHCLRRGVRVQIPLVYVDVPVIGS